MIVDDIQ